MRYSAVSTRAIAIAMPFVIISAAASAQTSVELDEIIISGGLAPIEQSKYGRSSTVLTAAEIERRGVQTVQDALRAVPGVAVSSAGSNYTQVRIRGGEGNHTMVLVDGVRMSSNSDEYMFAAMDTADIERIEVLRGPQSVYYGSNASSGVINIITKKATGTGYGGKVEFGNGHMVSGYVQTRTERGGLRFSVTDFNDDGYDFSGKNGEKDFTNRRTYRLSGDWQATEALRFSAELYHAREHYAYDNTAWPLVSYDDYLIDGPGAETYRRENQGLIAVEYGAEGDRVLHRLEYSQNRFNTQYVGYDWDKTETRALKYRATIGLDGSAKDASQRLFVMAEHMVDENSAAADFERKRKSLALEYRGEFANGLNIQAGVRHDKNNRFDDFTGWNFAGSYQLNDMVRVHASAGRASVNPSYLERFGRPAWSQLPSPDIIPEINESVDLGVELTSADGRGRIDLTVFSERLTKEIVSEWNGTGSMAVNKDGTGKRKGFELQGSYDVTDQLGVGLNYTYLDSTQGDGRASVRRPRHELGLQAYWTSADDRLSLNGDVRFVSGIKDNNTLTPRPYAHHTLPSFTTVNVAAQYKVNDHVTASARVTNLFDKKGQEVWGYTNQGRTAWIGLSANF